MNKSPPEQLLEVGIHLRRWQASDAEALQKAASSSIAELSRWMPWAASGYGPKEAEQFLEFTKKSWDTGEEYDYAIILDGQPAGSFGLMKPLSKKQDTIEIGYWLATSATSRGLATRATALLTKAAFELGAKQVQIRHQQLNERSSRIPSRLGFTNIGLHLLKEKGQAEKMEFVIWEIDHPPEL